MGKISRCHTAETEGHMRAKHPSKLGGARGQTFVEFALVAPLLFFLIFAVFDFGRLFFVEMNIQQAIQEAGRFASTGNVLPDPNNPGQNLTRIASIIEVAQQAAIGLGANIGNIQISSVNGGAGNPGGPGDTVTISVTTNLPLMTPFVGQFFPGGVFTFTSSTTFKNEPFSSSSTS